MLAGIKKTLEKWTAVRLEREAAADSLWAWQTIERCWAVLKGHSKTSEDSFLLAEVWPLWWLKERRRTVTWLLAVAIGSDSCVVEGVVNSDPVSSKGEKK